MKSSLKIALGAGNEPVIHLNIIPSDDIRDQLCCQFMHKLGGESNLCHVVINGAKEIGSPVTHLVEISPIAPKELHPALVKVSSETLTAAGDLVSVVEKGRESQNLANVINIGIIQGALRGITMTTKEEITVIHIDSTAPIERLDATTYTSLIRLCWNTDERLFASPTFSTSSIRLNTIHKFLFDFLATKNKWEPIPFTAF